MPKKSGSTLVTMEDLFQYMKAVQDEHGVRLGYLVFPVANDAVPGMFGATVQVRAADGHVIREVTCSTCYWPSDKYTSFEAALMDCMHSVSKQYEEEYLPLIAYLSRNY